MFSQVDEEETKTLSMYPEFDYDVIENCQLYVYFHQARMDILLEGISYVGVWSDESRELLISVSDGATNVEDGKIYSFEGSEEEQDPNRIARNFEECVRLIMLDKAEDYEDPTREFPRYY